MCTSRVINIEITLNMADTVTAIERTSDSRWPRPPDLHPLDDLFEAIRHSDLYKTGEILKRYPKIVNMANIPTETKNPSSPQKLLEEGKLGNLMTPDVLMHLQGRPVTVDTYGMQRPLHVACIFGGNDVVEFLLRQPGIDVNSKNGAGECPLGIACRAAHLRVAVSLLQNFKGKVRVNQQDSAGNTPISYLAGRGIYPVWSEERPYDELETLVQAMLDVSREDSDGTNYREFSRLCMEAACRHGHVPLLRILIELAPDSINLRDKDGRTALHFAILCGEDEVVDLLLEAGADVGPAEKDSAQTQPLDLAVAHGERSIEDKIRNRLLTKPEGSEISTKKTPSGANDTYLDYLKAQIWPRKIKQSEETKRSTGESEFLFESVPVRDILKQGSLDFGSNEFMWCHLPANNVRTQIGVLLGTSGFLWGIKANDWTIVALGQGIYYYKYENMIYMCSVLVTINRFYAKTS